jgi:hypothetical protein
LGVRRENSASISRHIWSFEFRCDDGASVTKADPVRSIPVFVRPCTPDLAIAKICFAGEFDAAIVAVKPLKHDFIIDGGGYIGSAAIMLAKAFPDATIASLEPSRENFAALAMNTAAYPNVIPLNMALGSTEGSTQLVDRGTGEVGFSTVQAPADCASPSRLHEVAGDDGARFDEAVSRPWHQLPEARCRRSGA